MSRIELGRGRYMTLTSLINPEDCSWNTEPGKFSPCVYEGKDGEQKYTVHWVVKAGDNKKILVAKTPDVVGPYVIQKIVEHNLSLKRLVGNHAIYLGDTLGNDQYLWNSEYGNTSEPVLTTTNFVPKCTFHWVIKIGCGNEEVLVVKGLNKNDWIVTEVKDFGNLPLNRIQERKPIASTVWPHKRQQSNWLDW